MFVKETGGPVDALWPLVSGVAVLMGRQSNRKDTRMKSVTMYRANVRKLKRHPNAIRADRAAQALAYYRVAALREPGVSVDTVLSDFLSDLRHFCDRVHLHLAKLDRMAHRNYLTEKYSR
ncbi:MAG: hypothetical protein CV088_00595 [Nitrospira sp. LK70]|nr:hypothetical protein [Nitrospira sp. LK70]